MSAQQNAQALKRLEAIAPLLEFSSRSRLSRPTFRTIGGVAVRSMTSLAGYLADQHHVSPRTLWNWYAQYRKLGYAALVDRVRSDKGKSRFLAAHPAVRAYLENKYLGERLSIRLVYQALLRDLRSLEPECTRPPSYSAVRSYLKQLPKPLLILSREGSASSRSAVSPICSPTSIPYCPTRSGSPTTASMMCGRATTCFPEYRPMLLYGPG